ncbi:hypothetical protein SISNIDRAFT_455310 [Sistotremastrum niveocremeum HHB9708]|uniref:Uncharacterized protein n=2 Tax=Sistotremastraceae TaxID=3402574 RepID=A0A164TX08_9AGAM|nr:hypothetical protein SISNIDRAFT_455310 [Sistotremastrum niveocremeum HHB9708]KZT41766.1 hypothetical protein SISSUDRAFT_1042265 [Sistotremastrum suecicum HHB10207 ss-3]
MSNQQGSQLNPAPSTKSMPGALSADQFTLFLSAIQELNGTIKGQNDILVAQKTILIEQRKTLEDHGKKFDVLIRDALKGKFVLKTSYYARNNSFGRRSAVR